MNTTTSKNYLRARAGSFGYAFRGLLHLVLQEPNAKIHAIATVSAIAAGCIRHLHRSEWLAVIFAIALVWMAEAFNTAMEMLCDLQVGTARHPAVKIIKDVAAGGVLLAAVAALCVGVAVFLL